VVSPVLPSRLHDVLADVAKSLRLYALYVHLRFVPSEPVMPPQQQWLYEESPPAELDEGLRVLGASYQRLARLSARDGFRVTVVDWVDWGLVRTTDPQAATQRARKKVQAETPWPFVEVDALANAGNWDGKWLIPGTRHANAAATELISRAICGAMAR